MYSHIQGSWKICSVYTVYIHISIYISMYIYVYAHIQNSWKICSRYTVYIYIYVYIYEYVFICIFTHTGFVEDLQRLYWKAHRTRITAFDDLFLVRYQATNGVGFAVVCCSSLLCCAVWSSVVRCGVVWCNVVRCV